MFLQKITIQFPVPTRQLSTTCDSSSRGPNTYIRAARHQHILQNNSRETVGSERLRSGQNRQSLLHVLPQLPPTRLRPRGFSIPALLHEGQASTHRTTNVPILSPSQTTARHLWQNDDCGVEGKQERTQDEGRALSSSKVGSGL